jgi:hypothetical protein
LAKLLWGHRHSACFGSLTTDKYLDDCPCCKAANEVCSVIWMGRQEWISSNLFQRPDVFWFFARPCLFLQRKICVHERMHLFLGKSILHRPLPSPSWRFMPQWKYPPSNI